MVSALVCDDGLLFAEALANVLSREGVTVTVGDRDDATAEGHRYSHVVLGAENDGVRAAELVSRVRGAHPQAVLVSLGTDAPEPTRLLREAGADVLLSKRGPLHDVIIAVCGRPPGPGTPARHRHGSLSGPPSRRSDTPLAAHFLTSRERDVLWLLVAGASTEAMVTQLSISRTTVRCHVRSIFARLGVHSRMEAVRYAHAHRLVAESR